MKNKLFIGLATYLVFALIPAFSFAAVAVSAECAWKVIIHSPPNFFLKN